MVERDTVLVVGGGAREQAIAHALSKSPSVASILIAPGNAGTDELNASSDKQIKNVEITDDVCSVVDVAKKNNVSMVIVGPEEWLSKEVGDVLEEEKIKAIAPKVDRAILELDKTYTRDKCFDWGVPQPRYACFEKVEDAWEFVKRNDLSEGVVKVSGPALGKGVVVCDSQEEILNAIEVSKKKFGKAADKIIVEEKLCGYEVSYIVLTDGENFVPLSPSMDHKRIFDGDLGPNTGGMGVISPNPNVSLETVDKIESQIIKPILRGMKSEGKPYTGVLYAGVMMTSTGPKLIEINARFGDPETQSQLQLLNYDFYELCKEVVSKKLNKRKVNHHRRSAVSVVLAAGGYPDSPKKGDKIHGLEKKLPEGVTLYHAGTKSEHGEIYTNGGRVMTVTAVSTNSKQAREKAYSVIGENGIYFDGMQYRKDIGVIKNLR